jgi:hypothetical protein
MEVAELSAMVKTRGDKQPPKGKKEAQREAAAEVEGIFSPRQSPGRMN